ncbi:MAG: DUF4406 domain-containing protein [Bacilli bacterium]
MKKIYVAHPYGGKDENRIDVEKIVLQLTAENPNILYISPIHATGYLYNVLSYDDGMRYCYALLDCCDELLLCNGWQDSKGCSLEEEYAMRNDISITYLNEKKELIRIKAIPTEYTECFTNSGFDFNKEYLIKEIRKDGSIVIKNERENGPAINYVFVIGDYKIVK